MILRDGLAQLLRMRGHQVVAAVGDVPSLHAAVSEHTPDIAVVDVRMPPSYTDEGLRAAVDLQRTHPALGVLVFSQYVETRFASQLLSGRHAGIGYLLKDRVADLDEFIDALERVRVGGTALDPEVVTQLVRASRRHSVLASLTTREREVLSLMAQGHSNSTISKNLVVSERAVEKHVSNIFLKLDLPPSEPGHRRVLAVLRFLESS